MKSTILLVAVVVAVLLGHVTSNDADPDKNHAHQPIVLPTQEPAPEEIGAEEDQEDTASTITNVTTTTTAKPPSRRAAESATFVADLFEIAGGVIGFICLVAALVTAIRKCRQDIREGQQPLAVYLAFLRTLSGIFRRRARLETQV